MSEGLLVCVSGGVCQGVRELCLCVCVGVCRWVCW